MELNWSSWFRCESSFGLLLVPHQPGVYALGEETLPPTGGNMRRVLAVIEIDEAQDLSRALSRLFAPASPWSSRMNASRCYLRYAIVPDEAQRHAATLHLRNWLSSQLEAAARLFEQPGMPAWSCATGGSDLTVAERAVDRVMKGREKELVARAARTTA
jgi:hypothetical protein